MNYNKNIILAVNKNPWIRCYRIHAYVMNIVGNFIPSFEKYVLSNYLCLHNGKEGKQKEYLDFHLENNYLNNRDIFRDNSWFDIIKLQDIGRNIYTKQSEFKDIIIYLLSKGYYLLQNLNDGELPHSSIYKITNTNNISLIHGYDFEKDSFYILDYNRNGSFGTSIVKSNNYMDAMATAMGSNNLNFIRAKDDLIFEFDSLRAYNLLTSYVESRNSYPNNYCIESYSFGYDGVERALKDSELNGLNIVRMRVIKEHKEMVLRYMEYILKNNFIDDSYYYKEYKRVCCDMNVIFMKILKKMISFEKYDNFLDDINSIREVNKKECDILGQYLMCVKPI